MRNYYLERKKIFLTALCLLVLLVSVHAQLNSPIGSGSWKYGSPSQFGFVLQGMSFVDNNTGLAVGLNGSIARSTDGGYTWQYIFYKYVNPANSVVLPSFTKVHFVTPSVAYAVGSLGVMIKSIDGGITWTKITTPLTALSKNINALYFINKDTGYIAGASITTGNTTNIDDAPKVYVTKDGGSSWNALVSPFVPQQNNTTLNWNNQKEITSIHFVNDSIGYVCGNSSGSTAVNGNGQSALLWKIEKEVITDYSLHRTKFGLSAGAHGPSGQRYLAVIGINDSLALMSGTNGTIMRIRTGKNDLTASAAPAIYGDYVKGTYELVAQVNSIPTFPVNTPLNPSNMVYLKKTPDGKIALCDWDRIGFTSDNGTSWTASTVGMPYSWWSLWSMDITPNGRIIAAGDGGVLFDSLPGGSWRTQYKHARPIHSTDNSTGVLAHFTAIDWADYCNGVIVGAYGTFVKTSDGGKTWVNNTNSVFQTAAQGISGVAYQAVDKMYFLANSKSFYRSADQGTTNDVIFTEPTSNGVINAFTMIGVDSIWAVGYRSNVTERTMIFRSRNASAAIPVWDTVKAFPTGTSAPQPRNIKFANIDTGYVTCNLGKVYRTVDGGNTWTDVSPDPTAPGNSTANFTALSVVNGKTLYVGGSNKKIWRSTDAGVTWTNLTLALTTPTTISDFSSITAIEMNDVNNGYAITGTFLLKTTDGWATWSYDMAPIAFSNMQLYPKVKASIQNKKLFYLGTVQIGFDFSKVPATVLEYGDATTYNMSTSATSTAASCTSPTGGSITITATGGIAPYSYSVNGGAFQSSNVLTGLTQGTKTITIKDAACAVVTKTVNVGFTDNLILTTNNDTIVCVGASVQMLASTNGTGATYAWTPTSGLSNAGISNPVATINTNSAYSVRATLNGCVRTKTVTIGTKPGPVVDAGADKTIVEGDMVQLQGSANNIVSIAWTPSTTLTNANILTPMAKPAATTTYTLSVKNSDNCTSTDNVVVNVVPYCIKVANAFSPNGDGTNDRWVVTTGSCTNQVKVRVFNRYGQEVYKNDNYQNNWDGTFGAKAIPDGTYYYVIDFRTLTGKAFTLKGDVTILR